MDEWVDLASAIANAFPHPRVQRHGWHAEGCNKSEARVDLDCLSSWVMLQLQPEQHDIFPAVCHSMHLAKDGSLSLLDATVMCYLCSNSKSHQDRSRHYWVVELEEGVPKYVFDSLMGKHRLTQELAKKLCIFGVLLNVGQEKTPCLRTKYLDEAAGVTPESRRSQNPFVYLDGPKRRVKKQYPTVPLATDQVLHQRELEVALAWFSLSVRKTRNREERERFMKVRPPQ